jgi:ribosomal subunit interface protein
MLRIVLSAEKFELTPELEKYAQSKLDELEKAIPRGSRRFSHAEVTFRQTGPKTSRQNTVQLTLYLPRERFEATETTQHMYSALDIATMQIREQLKAHRTGRSGPLRRGWRRLKPAS